MIGRNCRRLQWLSIVTALLCALFAAQARASVIDDLRILIHELANAPSHVIHICLDAFNALSAEMDNYTLSLTNNAVSERGLTATAAADAVSTVAEVERLQAAGNVNLKATTIQFVIDAQAKTDQLSRDAGAGLAQISDVMAAIKRAQRQGYDSGSQAVTSFVNSLLSPLNDYLNDLLSHPWDFDLADVQTGLAALGQAFNDAPQKMKDSVVLATQMNMAQLRAIVTGLQQKRLEAQRLAKAAADALAQDLGQPRVSSGMPQSVDEFVAPDLDKVATRVVTAQQAGVNTFYDQLDLLASKAWVSAQQAQATPGTEAPGGESQGSGAPAPGGPGGSGDALALFGTMPNFKVEESEAVEFDYYTFGYLPNAPRLEGRRTTVNYWLIPGSAMPGALGICRHFADATRQAGGEVLYDNDRNIITVRMNQAGHETWAEFACDKDRYRVNIIERNNGGGNAQAADVSNIMKTKHDTVKNSTSNIVVGTGAGAVSNPKVFDSGGQPASETNAPAVVGAAPAGRVSQPNQSDAEFLRAAKEQKAQKTWRPANFKFELGNLSAAQLLARSAGRFSVVVDAPGSAGLPTPAQCADPPTLRRIPGRVKYENIVLKQGLVDQIRAGKLNLVDTNMWSCHIKDGRLVEGALVTDRPLN